MSHLTPEQFVDVAEGTASEQSVPHLASCDACRSELAEMRDEVAMAAGGTSDAVVGALTENESRELQRLLTEELARPRALEKRS